MAEFRAKLECRQKLGAEGPSGLGVRLCGSRPPALVLFGRSYRG